MLAAQPGTLIDGMLVGSQTLVNFNVVNNGGAASGPLQVLVPQASFLSLSSPATIGSLAPGQSTTVTLQLLPGTDLAAGILYGHDFPARHRGQPQRPLPVHGRFFGDGECGDRCRGRDDLGVGRLASGGRGQRDHQRPADRGRRGQRHHRFRRHAGVRSAPGRHLQRRSAGSTATIRTRARSPSSPG